MLLLGRVMLSQLFCWVESMGLAGSGAAQVDNIYQTNFINLPDKMDRPTSVSVPNFPCDVGDV